jgi:hypothetical protein
VSTNNDNLLTIAEFSGKCESTAAWIRDQVESGLMPSGVKNAAPYAKDLSFALSTAPTNPDVPILKPKTGQTERVNRTVEQVSKISQMASPDIRGQLEFPGVPDRSPHRVNQVFRTGGQTRRHEFRASTQLGAVLEDAREQRATTIEIEENAYNFV